MVNFLAVYVLLLRELKRFTRAKARIISSVMMPVLMLIGLGFGFSRMSIPGVPVSIDYLTFLIPGMICMSLATSSVMSGISVLWDREFGFLKEIMVAPVDRFSIVLGRIAGGVVTSVIQGFLIFIITLFMGLQITSIYSFLTAVAIMFLISAAFVGFGLIFSSILKDIQGFSSVMSLIVLPLVFLSGAFTPLENLPWFIKMISYIDPLTYGVDGLRASLINVSSFPVGVDILVLIGIASVFITIGTILFKRTEGV